MSNEDIKKFREKIMDLSCTGINCSDCVFRTPQLKACEIGNIRRKAEDWKIKCSKCGSEI